MKKIWIFIKDQFDPHVVEGRLERAAFIAAVLMIVGLAASNGLFQIAYGVFVGLSLASMVFKRRLPEIGRMCFALLAAYLIVNGISAVFTDYHPEAIQGFSKVVRRALLFVCVIYVLDSRPKLVILIKAFLYAAILLTLDSIFQSVMGFDFLRHRSMTPYHGDVYRITATFSHANDFAAYLTITFFITMTAVAGWKYVKNPVERTIGIAAFMGTLWMLVATYSRGAWVSVFVAFLLMSAYKRNKKLILALVLVTAAGLAASPDLVKERVRSIFDLKNGTIAQRCYLWNESLKMIEQNPWFGVGVNTYAKYEPYYKQLVSAETDVPKDQMYAHNGYLQTAAETGLVGLTAFLALLLYVLGTSLKAFWRLAASRDPVAEAGVYVSFGVLAFLAHSATDTNLHSTLLVNLLWLGLAMIWSARRLTLK